ncbi:DEAD/DEAH box helicase [Cephaloticoccus capnophilus]|uniref:DEAD/DEAH box helicase n=2 Tax=Cephaloticoccus capnophilus TaxID=1548208 RepID=A0A139SQ44_9BACT|nr:DEAD/DEAH box helicase [Cephaloticoccus capnophilus]KXU36725.1 DEAD/DEAH box helicase [Cephaloticoccus capnophilus]
MFKKLISAVRGVFTPAKPASKKNPSSATTRRKSASTENPRRNPRGEKTRKTGGAAGERGSRGAAGESREGRGGEGSRGKPRSDSKGRSRSERANRAAPKKRVADDFEHPRREPIKPVVPVDVPKMDSAFSALGLCDALAYAVQEKGYTEPTPIQAQSIPVILEGRDLIGSAQTGTGKTAAFALPIIQKLGGHGPLRCLVLEPTRELALQVEEAFQHYAKFTDLAVTIVYGGVGYGKQLEDLQRGVDILAATPGRLLDHLEQGNCSLADVDILVLDEVDRMLDMGFLPDVKRIVQQTPKSRQTLFFTATVPPEIASLAGWALRDPVRVEIGRQRSPAETVAHAFYPVVATQKFELLELLLEQTEFKSVIVFTRTRMGADRIASRLRESGHTVGVLHSDRSQRERVEALQGFKSGKFEVLVATDIAARGLDIAGVSHVVNYDVPENAEDYVHRIGRTGRAQTSGDAFTLVTEEDVRDARSIERYMGVAVERKKIDGFPYIYSALFDEGAQGGASPKPASRLHRGLRR